VRRLREETGQVAFELVGNLWWLLLAAFAAWQLLLAGWTAVSADNTARNASRAAGRGQDPRRAVDDSLPGPLHSGHNRVWVNGNEVRVRVAVPVILPVVHIPGLEITRQAALPGD
jgi:hypothetical protein